MKDVEEHKNLGVGVVGNLKEKEPIKAEKEPEAKKITKKELKEGMVNEGIRTAKAEYLRHCTKTVGIINEKGEYEIKLTKNCGEGDVVWVLEDDGTFTKTKIY
jgi:predicted  nucleic acid-binding Zn-ribbon protein